MYFNSITTALNTKEHQCFCWMPLPKITMSLRIFSNSTNRWLAVSLKKSWEFTRPCFRRSDSWQCPRVSSSSTSSSLRSLVSFTHSLPVVSQSIEEDRSMSNNMEWIPGEISRVEELEEHNNNETTSSKHLLTSEIRTKFSLCTSSTSASEMRFSSDPFPMFCFINLQKRIL